MGCNESKQAVATGNALPRRSFRKRLSLVKPKESDPISQNNAHIVTRNPSARKPDPTPTPITDDDAKENVSVKKDSKEARKSEVLEKVRKKVEKKVQETTVVLKEKEKEKEKGKEKEKEEEIKPTSSSDEDGSSFRKDEDGAESIDTEGYFSVKGGDSKDDGESKDGGDDHEKVEEKSLTSEGEATPSVVDEDLKTPNLKEDEKDEKYFSPYHGPVNVGDLKDDDVLKEEGGDEKVAEKSLANEEEVANIVHKEKEVIKVSQEDDKDEENSSSHQGLIKDVDLEDDYKLKEAKNETIEEKSLASQNDETSLVEEKDETEKVLKEDDKVDAGEENASLHHDLINDVNLNNKLKDKENVENIEEKSLAGQEEETSLVDEENEIIEVSQEHDKDKPKSLNGLSLIEGDTKKIETVPSLTTMVVKKEDTMELEVPPSDSPRKDIN